MLTARDFVLDLLRKWTVLSEPPFLPERSDDVFGTLPARDRAFAFDLLTGVIRWRGCLDAVIGSRLRQPMGSLDHGVQAVLWLGAYQLLFQGGTTDYAAVDTTVALAKKHRDTAKAAGLVNAVLRGITRLEPKKEARMAGAAGLSRRTIAVDLATQIKVAEDIFPNPATNPIGYLAAVRSHPAAYVEHLRNIYGEGKAGELLLRNNVRPVVTLRVDAESLDVPAAAGLVAHTEAPRFVVAKQGWNPQIEEQVKKGNLSPQDVTAAKPVRQVAELIAGKGQGRMPATILDLCAGLGTKSLQLARAFPGAQVTAADVDSVKLARLQARAEQVGQKNIRTEMVGGDGGGASGLRAFDMVLVDVPCSNTGVMAKRVQSRWRWPSLDHGALRQLQIKLLAQGLERLGTGGLLIYSTCSIDPVENGKLISGFLGALPEGKQLRILHEEATLPSLTSEAEASHDGGYFVVLARI